jgi:IS605 OrfB family transposase
LPKARVGLDYKAAKVFKEVPHPILATVFRKHTEALAKKTTVEVVDCDPLKDARTDANQPQFDYFSNLAFIASAKPEKKSTNKRKVVIEEEEEDDSEENRANWFEFDLVAFVEALKSPHRFLQDTVQRKGECDRLEKRLNAMRGGGEGEQGEGDDDTSERLRGFKGDYRIGLPGDVHANKKGVYQLIRDEKLLAYREDDDSDGDEEIYGLNENTLRGWNELRRKWREAAGKEEFKGEAKKKDLLDELDRIRRDELGDRPEEAGSGPLFKRLLEVPEYHCIWKDPPPDPDVHWEDPLWGWVSYHELQDELEKTKRPIRFTPGHATESPRFFIFPKQNRKKSKAPARGKATAGSKTDHLPGMFAFNDEGKLVEVAGDEAWLKDRPRFMAAYAGLVLGEHPNLQPTPVRIIFSAPRLRRDHIRSDKENSLGSISLLQPMLEALGIVSEHLPEINFANCPMTLLAERRKRPNELAEDESDQEQKKTDRYDLNLSFPVTLEEEKLKEHEFFQHAKRWVLQSFSNKKTKARMERHTQFQFSGDNDMREIALRWPIDREHSPRTKSDETPGWYQTMSNFSCLSIDLGQREGGAYAVLDVCANAEFGKNKQGKPVPSRLIGKTDGKEWRAALAASGLLKLPGEDALSFRPRLKADENTRRYNNPSRQDTEQGKKFREEPWGDEGRPPLRSTDPGALIDETEKARELLGKDGFDQLDIMPPGWDKRRDKPEQWGKPNTELSFPEQNDKLIVAARRYLSRIRRLHRWCAFLNAANWPNKADKAAQKRQRALQEIREACGLDELGAAKLDDKNNAPLEGEAWLAPTVKQFVVSGTDDSRLAGTLRGLLEPMLEKLPSQFLDLANRCSPLRARSWRWTKHQKSTTANPLHILLPTNEPKPNAKMLMPDGKERNVTWIRGQRGLSMKRIAQLEDLRRLFQSLNQIQRREIGTMPPRRKRGEKGDELPDCCPKLLAKLDDLKEQRVNQMAHHVLALALGLRLKKSGPTKSEAEREHSDIHGEYERIPDSAQAGGLRRPVDFIVIEDLKYYETTRVRSRRENVRLMRWCRRHFRDKLKQLCDVFGFPVVEANPSNTSKFCARTGIAGFRAVEVGPGFHEEYVWRKALEKLDKSRREKTKLEPDDLGFCEGTEHLKKQVKEAQEIPTESGKALPCPRTLLAPLGSGNVFVPVVGEVNNAGLPPAIVQADVNAAVMLALRAIADPRLWEFHPRLRTRPPEQKKKSKKLKGSETEVPPQSSDDNLKMLELFVAEKRKFGAAEIKLDLTDALPDGVIKDSRKPNYFRDLAGFAASLRNLPEPEDAQAKRSLNFARLLVAKDKVSLPEPQNPQTRIDLLSGKAFWLAVKKLQWQRCLAINAKRIAAWKGKLNSMPD